METKMVIIKMLRLADEERLRIILSFIRALLFKKRGIQ